MNKKTPSSASILIISENIEIINSFETIAKQNVSNITICKTPLESFEILQNKKIDIVFIDSIFTKETAVKIIAIKHMCILLVNEVAPDINYQENGIFCAINKAFTKEQFLTAISAGLYAIDSVHDKNHSEKLLAEYKKAIDAGFIGFKSKSRWCNNICK